MQDQDLFIYLPKKRTSDEPISSFTEVIGNVPTPWKKGDVITFPATIEGNSFKTKIGNKKYEYIVVNVKSVDGSERQADFFPSLFHRRVRKYYREETNGVEKLIQTNDFLVAGGSIVTEIYDKSRKVNDVVTAVLGKSIRISEVDFVLSLKYGTTDLEITKVYDFEPEGWTIGNVPTDIPEDTTTDLDAIKKIENTYGNGLGTGLHNGHEWVDLGLSVKWATCNVGARSPWESGDLFAWGETEPKETYSDLNSLTFRLGISKLESIGFIDGKGNLTSSYDAATVNWGGRWRMPTSAEMEELVDNCRWEWIIDPNGKYRKVTGPNGNSIFLPAEESSWNLDASYWSSTPYDDYYGYGYNAYDLYLGSVYTAASHHVSYEEDRMIGKYVRPVLE